MNTSIHTRLMQLQDKAEDEAVNALARIDDGDPERAHGQADDVLLTFLKESGFEEVATAYNDLVDRCGWWGAG